MNQKPKLFKLIKPIFFIAYVFFFTSSLYGENRALLIGIENYNHPGLNLRGPIRDVELMKEIAMGIGFKENQIKTLTNSQASRALILDAFSQWLIKGVESKDKILFYYSGHGAQVVDKNNDEDDGCDETLVPFDITISPKAMITDDEINNLLKQVKAEEKLFILDSCHSGTATRGFPLTRSTGKLYCLGKMVVQENCKCNQPVNRRSISLIDSDNTTPKKYISISASAQNEIAQAALKMGEGSVFTQGLYETVKNSRGILSFKDLRDQVSQKVREKTTQFNRPCHTPQLEGNNEWFNKNFLEFSKSMEQVQEQAYTGGIQHAASDSELFDRIINNRHFAVNIKTQKESFSIGARDKIEFTINSSKSGYMNIIVLNPDGILVLFPNEFSNKKSLVNKVEAWQDVNVPGSIGGFKFDANPPPGISRVIVLVTKMPLDLYKEKIGKLTGQFRSISTSDFKALKRGTLRSIGVSEDKAETPEEDKYEFGAGEIYIRVKGG